MKFQVQRRIGASGVYWGIGDFDQFGAAYELLHQQTINADYRIISENGRTVEKRHVY